MNENVDFDQVKPVTQSPSPVLDQNQGTTQTEEHSGFTPPPVLAGCPLVDPLSTLRPDAISRVIAPAWMDSALKETGVIDPTTGKRIDLKDIQASRTKKKMDYRLYPIYQYIMNIFTECKPVLDELFTNNEDGTLGRTATASTFSDISDDAGDLVDQIDAAWRLVRFKPDDIRRKWIKDKIPQDRFSKGGQDAALALSGIGDDALALSVLVLEFQIQLQKFLSNQGVLND